MKKFLWGILLLLLALILFVLIRTFTMEDPQPEAVTPPEWVKPPRDGFAERLGAAIRIQTISHKPGMIDEAAFDSLHAFIRSNYPFVFSMGEDTVMGSHSLLIRIPGMDPMLKPMLVMGHMDVVPVERSSEDQWIYPPFSGAVEGGFIWGRGTLDDKSGVIGILEATQMLLEAGWRPDRDLFLSFGQDEEIGGDNGAVLIAEYFRQEKTEFSVILDEGGILARGVVPGVEGHVALVGIAEKGYVSLELSVRMEGGHSSMPQRETALTKLIHALETLDRNPFPQTLTPPLEGFMAYLGPHMGFTQRMAFASPNLFKPLILDVYDQAPGPRALTQTTMVPTVIHAGIKDNVIPSTASALVNLRLLPGETAETARERVETIIGDTTIRVGYYDIVQDPSGVSDYRSEAFQKFGMTIKQVFPEVLVAPYLTIGATDARHFDGLSPNIYRFLPNLIDDTDLARMHGLNERISVDAMEKNILFYQAFLVNFSADE